MHGQPGVVPGEIIQAGGLVAVVADIGDGAARVVLEAFAERGVQRWPAHEQRPVRVTGQGREVAAEDCRPGRCTGVVAVGFAPARRGLVERDDVGSPGAEPVRPVAGARSDLDERAERGDQAQRPGVRQDIGVALRQRERRRPGLRITAQPTGGLPESVAGHPSCPGSGEKEPAGQAADRPGHPARERGGLLRAAGIVAAQVGQQRVRGVDQPFVLLIQVSPALVVVRACRARGAAA